MDVQGSIRSARERLQQISDAHGRPMTAAVMTFGCQMNARDSEKLRGVLEEIGFFLTDSEDADLVLYNTCTVREHADRKVYGRLGRMLSLKKKNPDKIIALCGCMMQEEHVRTTIREKYPFVNFVFGTHNPEVLPSLVESALMDPSRQTICVEESTDEICEDLPEKRKYAYKAGVTIMIGCDNFCSYCIVPYVRGREKSRKPEDILNEVRARVEDGVKEIMLLGQNVNSYGKKEGEGWSFAELLREVACVPGVQRVRFMTSHPKDLSDDLIDVMASHPQICPHLHLPMQSGSTRILEAMHRKYTKEQYLALVRRIRLAMPDISLTTDIIVGFPGETEEDFLETLSVVEEARFDTAFTFLYSRRTGTPAAEMEDQIPSEIAHERFDRLLERVQQIGKEQTSRFEGRTMDVLVEEVNEQLPDHVTGRLGNNILVHFPGDASLIGTIVPVYLERCQGFYYLGKKA